MDKASIYIKIKSTSDSQKLSQRQSKTVITGPVYISKFFDMKYTVTYRGWNMHGMCTQDFHTIISNHNNHWPASHAQDAWSLSWLLNYGLAYVDIRNLKASASVH